MSMRMESVAVLRWVPSDVLAEGEDAVVELLEEALQDAIQANGLTPAGPLQVRQVDPAEYPQVLAGKPTDDPDAMLHLAEVDVEVELRDNG